MEVALAVGTLKVAYHLLIVGIKVDQVPNAVRRCIELVRTCHRDLEDLIKLRNESLPMLESKPAILQRINSIIENAHNGLLEVARLVEKLRPEAHDGSSPLMSRLEWIFIDSREFSSQEPLISRQHSSVIAELNFLRQLILLTPLIEGSASAKDKGGTGEAQAKRPAIAWDNVGLLDEMLGGRKQNPPQVTPTPVPAPQTAPVGRVASPTPTISDPPPPYSSPKPSQGFPVPSAAPTSSTNPIVYNVTVPSQGLPVGGSGGNLYTEQMKASTENLKKSTTFDADGISFLFGDLKLDPKPAGAFTTAALPATQPTASTSLATGTATSYPWTVPRATSPIPQTNAAQAPASHHPSSTTNNYAQGPKLPTAYESYQISQQTPQQVTQAIPQLHQPSQPQPRPQTPNMHSMSGPHPHPHPQSPPVPAKDEPVFEVKPLSTIPQELIHRHDGVMSPPLQPLFSPLLGHTAVVTTPPLSFPTSTVHLPQHQTCDQRQHEARVPPSLPQGNLACCSSCGSARNSLPNVPSSITSRPSSLNMTQSFHSSHPNPASYQPIHQYPNHEFGDPFTRQARADEVHTQGNPSYPLGHGWDTSQPNPTQTVAPRSRPSTAEFHRHTVASEMSFPHTEYAPSSHHSNPDPSWRYSTPQPATQTSQMPIAHSFAAQPHFNTQDAWRRGQSTQHQQLPQTHPMQSSAPSIANQSKTGLSHPNPAFQTFATNREHWRPETLTGASIGAPSQTAQAQNALGYPSHPSDSSRPHHPENAFQVQHHNNRVDSRTIATERSANATNTVFETEAAELCGSSALMPGLDQRHDEGRWYVRTHDGVFHTEVHELPSVKFAPDPVELE